MIVEVPVVLKAFHFLRSDCTKRERHLTVKTERDVGKLGRWRYFSKKIQFIHQTTYFPDGILRHNCSTLHGGKRKKNKNAFQ